MWHTPTRLEIAYFRRRTETIENGHGEIKENDADIKVSKQHPWKAIITYSKGPLSL